MRVVRRLMLKTCGVPRLLWILLLTAVCLRLYHLRRTVTEGSWLIKENDIYTTNQAKLSLERRVIRRCILGQRDCLNDSKDEAQSDISGLGLVRNKQDKYVRDIGYKNHAFNALVSNNIGVHREIPDTRHKVCPRNIESVNALPTASIIMCFYNEHKMTLIRSLNSVLMRTPPHLLHEIILVDDNSNLPELEFHLLPDLHAALQYNGLRYMRNEARQGLIRSRVIGARESTGDVLIFLDSHIEVNKQWAEPLLQLIQTENSTLAVPVIDIINADTFEYTASPLVRGGFNWGLHYKWDNLPEGTLKNESDFKGKYIYLYKLSYYFNEFKNVAKI